MKIAVAGTGYGEALCLASLAPTAGLSAQRRSYRAPATNK